MHLLTFNPATKLTFKVANSEVTERELFDAFWIIYKGGDAACPAESSRMADKLLDMIESKTIPGGSIRMKMCGACGQRVMIYDELRTIQESGIVHIRLEDKQFKYLQDCVAKWPVVPSELRRYFGELQDRLEASKALSVDQIDAIIALGKAIAPEPTAAQLAAVI